MDPHHLLQHLLDTQLNTFSVATLLPQGHIQKVFTKSSDLRHLLYYIYIY